MIDYHTHILPGIDDGSKSPEESIAMLRQEASQGITGVVLTSHFYAAQNSIQEYLKSRQKAWENLRLSWEPGLPKLYLGAEVQYFEGISVAEDVSDLRIEGTKLLLLEMPFSPWSDRVIQDVLSLNERADIQIVLAHIDRYLNFQPNDLWPWLSDHGIMMQANTSFFQNIWTRPRAMHMLKQGLIQMLGTDCHSMNNRVPDWSKVPQKVIDQMNMASYLPDAEYATP